MNYCINNKYSVVDRDYLEVLIRFLIENIDDMPDDLPINIVNDIYESIKLKSYQYFNQEALFKEILKNEKNKKSSTNSRTRKNRISRKASRNKIQSKIKRTQKFSDEKFQANNKTSKSTDKFW